MSDGLNSRSVAEHLFTLAGLLEAEARRMAVLRLEPSHKLYAEAHSVKQMAEMLWAADIEIDTSNATSSSHHGASLPNTQTGVHSGRRHPYPGINHVFAAKATKRQSTQ